MGDRGQKGDKIRIYPGAIKKVYRSVRDGYQCYSHQPKSVRGQYSSIRVGYMKYGRLHVEATSCY